MGLSISFPIRLLGLQAMARINKARERSFTTAKGAAVMAFLQKNAEQQNLGQPASTTNNINIPNPPSQPTAALAHNQHLKLHRVRLRSHRNLRRRSNHENLKQVALCFLLSSTAMLASWTSPAPFDSQYQSRRRRERISKESEIRKMEFKTKHKGNATQG